MTTVNELVDETQDLLYGSYRVLLDRLAVVLDDISDEVTLAEVTNLRPHSVLSVDSEDMLVRSFDATARIATVWRGWRSTAAPHAEGAIVEVNPRWTRGTLTRLLRQEIAGWPTNLFRVNETLFYVDAATSYVALDSLSFPSLRHVLRVGWTGNGTDLAWHWLPYSRKRPNPDPAVNGVMVELGDMVEFGTVVVQYGDDFALDPWLPSTDLELDVGLTPTMMDIPPMGVVARIMGVAEVMRTDRQAQGEPRLATESPAGHALQTGRELNALYRRRLAAEAQRLREKYSVGGW